MDSLNYNDDEAARFISGRTGESAEVAKWFIGQHWQFRANSTAGQSILDVHSDDGQPSGGMYIEAHSMSEDDLTMELAVIKMVSDAKGDRLSEARLARCVAEEVGYAASIGIVPEYAYSTALEWAEWVATL